jgi:hypothetical protein
MTRSATWSLALGFTLATAACTGEIGATGDDSGAAPGAPRAGAATGAPAGPSPPPATAAPGSTTFRRLTRTELVNSWNALLGTTDARASGIEDVRVMHDNSHEYASFAAGRDVFDGPSVRALWDDLAAVTTPLFTTAARREAFVGCKPTAVTDPCAATFLQRFLRRAFRRSPTAEEVQRASGVAGKVAPETDVWGGLHAAVFYALISPSFLYRSEVLVPEGGSGRKRVSGLSQATRLSFALLGQPPDDALLDAAERGELDTAAGLMKTATALYGRRSDARVDLVRQLLVVDGIEAVPRDLALYPKATAGLLGAMKRELELWFADLAQRDGGYRDLLLSRDTFANADLAALYGVPAPAGGFGKVTWPAASGRAGALGLSSWLTMTSSPSQTSPTRRGLFVFQRFLGQAVPQPPPDVDTTLPPASAGARTARERLSAHQQKGSPCAACHTLFDPIGLALENFDAIGARREKESGVVIDPSGVLDGAPFAGPAELATLLADRPEPYASAMAQLFRYLAGRLETEAEGKELHAVAEAWRSAGARVGDWYPRLVATDAFRYATEVSP